MEEAPLYNTLAEGPERGVGVWMHAADGVRVRVGGWKAGTKGTVLLFTGRTEYIEKYGRMARIFGDAGLSTLTCDWRGQGLSDRVASDSRIGHVDRFSDYQKDVAVLVKATEALDYPKPYFLLGHSMGGAIGLRALIEGLPVERAAFSGPMWGIGFSRWLEPLAAFLIGAYRVAGMGLVYAPGTDGTPYPFKQAFEDNALTHDPEHYSWLRTHVEAVDRLGIGGPSMAWMHEAMKEIEALVKVRDVPCPVLALVGSNETIVVPKNVHTMAGTWPSGRSETIPGARHEAMMELPDVRQDFSNRVLDHFLAD